MHHLSPCAKQKRRLLTSGVLLSVLVTGLPKDVWTVVASTPPAADSPAGHPICRAASLAVALAGSLLLIGLAGFFPAADTSLAPFLKHLAFRLQCAFISKTYENADSQVVCILEGRPAH
jgi:hypothetical protein